MPRRPRFVKYDPERLAAPIDKTLHRLGVLHRVLRWGYPATGVQGAETSLAAVDVDVRLCIVLQRHRELFSCAEQHLAVLVAELELPGELSSKLSYRGGGQARFRLSAAFRERDDRVAERLVPPLPVA